MPQQDNAWKEIIEEHFRDFLLFFFPRVHDAIDWKHKPQWLDKEFRILTRFEKGEKKDRDRRKRKKRSSGTLDKLAKVRLADGRSQWILAHVEVEGGRKAHFAERVHWYNSIISRHYQHEVLSLAVLTDDSKSHRPCCACRSLLGQVHKFAFPLVKVHDWEGKDDELASSKNVFAHVVRAYLALKRVKQGANPYPSRLELIRELYRQRMKRKNIISLLRFFEWLMALPMEVELRLEEEIRKIEGETRMPFLATFERVAMAKGEARGEARGEVRGEARGEIKGKVQGLLDAVELGLKQRFGAPGARLLPRAKKIQDLKRLQKLMALLLKADDVGEIKRFLAAQ